MKSLIQFAIVLVMLTLSYSVVHAQQEQKAQTLMDSTAQDSIYGFVEEAPQFPGGSKEMLRFLAEHLEYPTAAKTNGIGGRVAVQFVVEKNGKITQVKVARGIEASLDAEAIRVVNLMPNWKPGKKDGLVVRARFTLPITYNYVQAPSIDSTKH